MYKSSIFLHDLRRKAHHCNIILKWLLTLLSSILIILCIPTWRFVLRTLFSLSATFFFFCFVCVFCCFGLYFVQCGMPTRRVEWRNCYWNNIVYDLYKKTNDRFSLPFLNTCRLFVGKESWMPCVSLLYPSSDCSYSLSQHGLYRCM